MIISWDMEKERVKELSESGKTLQEIGDLYQVSKERIRQILKRYFPKLEKEDRGASKRKKLRLQERKQELIRKFNRETYMHLSDLERRQGLFFSRKRQNNKGKGKWEWGIVMSDVEWPTHCPMLGIELDWYAESRQENSPSIDRLDSTKGYIPGNVIICSWRANRIKNNGTGEEHRKIAEFLDNKLK